MNPVAQPGCGVDSPIVASTLKGEKEDRRAGMRRKREREKKALEAIQHSARMDGLAARY